MKNCGLGELFFLAKKFLEETNFGSIAHEVFGRSLWRIEASDQPHFQTSSWSSARCGYWTQQQLKYMVKEINAPARISKYLDHTQTSTQTHTHAYLPTHICLHICILCVCECLYVWKQVFEEVLFQNLSMSERNIITKQKRQAQHERRQEGILI